MAHRIDLIAYVDGSDGSAEYYFEGHSGRLGAGDLDDFPGYSWFCFEAHFAPGCVELMKLGFTVKQIEEALP